MGARVLSGLLTTGATADIASGTDVPDGWVVISSRNLTGASGGGHLTVGLGDGSNARVVATRARNASAVASSSRRSLSTDYAGLNIGNGNLVEEATAAAIAGGLRFTNTTPPSADRTLSLLLLDGCQVEVGDFASNLNPADGPVAVPLSMGRPDGVIVISGDGPYDASTLNDSRLNVGWAVFPHGNVLTGGQACLSQALAHNVVPVEAFQIASQQYAVWSVGPGLVASALELEATSSGFRATTRLGPHVHQVAYLAFKFTDGTVAEHLDRLSPLLAGVRAETGYGMAPSAMLSLGSLLDAHGTVETGNRASSFGLHLIDSTGAEFSHSMTSDDGASPNSDTQRRFDAEAFRVPLQDGTDGLLADTPVPAEDGLSLDWTDVLSPERVIPSLVFGTQAQTFTGPTVGDSPRFLIEGQHPRPRVPAGDSPGFTTSPA